MAPVLGCFKHCSSFKFTMIFPTLDLRQMSSCDLFARILFIQMWKPTYMHVYACYKHILLIVQSQKNTSFMQENMFEIQTRAESKRRAAWRESHETGSNRGALKTSIHIPLLLCRSNTGRDRSARNLAAWVLWDRTGPFLPLHW